VILHSITNALCSVTGQNILGAKADELCQQGITDSAQYLKLALKDLDATNTNKMDFFNSRAKSRQ
jgi:2-C-methyl-D-erythritol 2,4-cyclodiphosphate synthase